MIDTKQNQSKSSMDNRNKINRIFKRIRSFIFCSRTSSRNDDEEETLSPIEIRPTVEPTPPVVYRQNLVRPSLLIPRQYFHDMINSSNSNPSVLIRRDFERWRCSYPNHGRTIYPPTPFSQDEMTLNELRRLSMLTWSRSVRRLNNEYRSTLNALEQIKEQIERNETTKVVDQRPNLTRSPIENVSFAPFEVREDEKDENKDSSTVLSPTEDEQSEEETTYTVEIIYRKIDPNSNEEFNPKKDLLIIRKDTTEEQFNSATTSSNDSSSDVSYVVQNRTTSLSSSSDRTGKRKSFVETLTNDLSINID